MNKYTLSGVNIPPEEFLRPFFGLGEKVCLRVFSDKPDSAFSGQKLECILENFPDIADSLKIHNDHGRGIYFVINYGGHEDGAIKQINAQFMECDDLPLEEQLAKIQAFPLEPSLIVKTRKSLHCYWLMKKAKVERFRHTQKQLIAQFGADPTCVNESRVFRLPGFYHCKEELVLVECIKFNPELRYTQEQLAAVLPEIPEETALSAASNRPVIDRGRQKGLVLTGKRCAFIQHCKKNAKTLSEPDWYAMISNLAVFENGESIIHRLSKPYPRYSFNQTQAKIDHFHQSETKPMTCTQIAERGYKCPRLNSCKAKSPAGLAFFPMTLPELRKALAQQKKINDPVADLQTAQQFVSDYLFNQEPVLTEPFIKYDLRQFFGFKAYDTRPIIAAYKEIYQAFADSRDLQRQKDGVPEWYRRTKTGE